MKKRDSEGNGHHSGKVVAVGCDWVTVTSTTKGGRETLWELGHRCLDRLKAKDEQSSRWHGNGYSGFKARGCTLGVRGDSVILRLSSSEAAQQWREAASTGENLTRLDLAVDVEHDVPVTSLGLDVYRSAGHVPLRNGRPPSRSRFVDGKGGQTTYIGSRSSEQFGRLYDKGVERRSRGPGQWWRWEVEFKGSHASTLARHLTAVQGSTRVIHSVVSRWFMERSGFAPPGVTTPVKYFVVAEPSTDEKRLHWLATGVRPTVSILIERLGRARVLTALGISPESRSCGTPLHKTLQRVS
jgi:hypothetical protein